MTDNQVVMPKQSPTKKIVESFTSLDTYLTSLSNSQMVPNLEDQQKIVISMINLNTMLKDFQEEASVNQYRFTNNELAMFYRIVYNFKESTIIEQEIKFKILGMIIRESTKEVKIPKAEGVVVVKYIPIQGHKIAEYLQALLVIKKIGVENSSKLLVSTYNVEQGIYTNDTLIIDKMMLAMQPTITKNARLDIIFWITTHAEFFEKQNDENLIPLNNGIFNIKTKELKAYSPEFLFFSKANINYNPNAKHPIFKSGFNFTNFIKEQATDEDDEKMLWQIIQYTLLLNKPKIAYFFLFDAVGNTGKSMFIKILIQIIGLRNVMTANVEALNQKFTPASIGDKQLVYGDENDKGFIEINETMKSIATGDPFKAEAKGENAYTASSTAMVIQLMNKLPRFKHMDGGTKRRTRIVEFIKSYEGQENEDIKNYDIKNQEFLEWVLLKGTQLPLEKITDSGNSQIIKGEIELDSNTTQAWCEER